MAKIFVYIRVFYILGQTHVSTPLGSLRAYATTDPDINRKLPTMIKYVQQLLTNTLELWFYHIKHDEKYMTELFLTLPELQPKRNDQLLQKHRKMKNTKSKMISAQFPEHTSGMVPGLCKHVLICFYFVL